MPAERPPRSPEKAAAVNSSPRKKRPPKTPPKEIMPDSEPSIWRVSKLPADEKGTSEAKTYYLLSTTDLASLSSRPIAHDVNYFTAHLYSHREVEQKAWEKIGSPKKWDARVKARRISYEARYPKLVFPHPQLLSLPRDEREALRPSQPTNVPPNTYERNSALKALSEQFPQPWIWKDCNMFLDKAGITLNSEREAFLKRALSELREYPIRPTDSLGVSDPSPSMDVLQAVLDRAPENPGQEAQDKGNPHTWGAEYLTELFNALINVLNEGGEEGWKTARWKVYDKYASIFGGVGMYLDPYGAKTWNDASYEWFLSRIDDFTGYDSLRTKCDAGRLYNERLPSL